MMRHPRLSKKLEETVLRMDARPMVIVVPPHAAGKSMSDAARQLLEARWGEHVDLVVSPDLRMLDDGMRQRLGIAADESELLIIDDVSVTGHRLRATNRASERRNLRGTSPMPLEWRDLIVRRIGTVG